MRLLVAVAFACLSVTLFPCDAFRTNSGGRQAWPSSRSPQRGHEKKCISEPCVSPHENRGVWLAHVHEPRSMPPARLGSHFCVRSRGCGTCDRGNFMNLSLFTTRTQETRTSLALGRRSTSRVRVQSYDQIFPNRRRIPVDRANGKSNMVLEEKDANHRSESSSDNVLISEVQNGDKDETAEDERCDVVIVGAGFAGLAAANKLRKGGVTNVVILEGRDRVGGRSVTSHELGAGDVDVPVDLGSAWVQGRTDNPVQALVDRHKIPHGLAGRDDDAATVWDCGGGVVTPERMKRLLKLRKRFLGYMKKRQHSDAVDTDLQTVADDFAAANDISDDSDDRRGLRWILDAEISQEYAAPLSEMSLWWWNVDEEFDGGDSYLAVPGGGYTALVDKFASPVSANVRLRCRVTGIDYGGADGVRVCYEHTDSDPQRDNRRKRATIVADHVLVTLPLGVLKAGTVEFSPTLPNSKQRAIRSLGGGLANKCALYWEGMEDSDVFWPRDKEWITRIAPVGEEQGRWTEFYNAHSMNGGMPLLVGFVTGANAARIECLSDEEVAAEALASLRCIFGKETVPEPTGCIVTRWGGDEFARGAYSFQKVGSEKSSRKKLAKPVGDRLWFAGEATHCRYPATTHGALLSGEDGARNILSEIRSD